MIWLPCPPDRAKQRGALLTMRRPVGPPDRLRLAGGKPHRLIMVGGAGFEPTTLSV